MKRVKPAAVQSIARRWRRRESKALRHKDLRQQDDSKTATNDDKNASFSEGCVHPAKKQNDKSVTFQNHQNNTFFQENYAVLMPEIIAEMMPVLEELFHVIQGWKTLPQPIRNGILAMVKSAPPNTTDKP